MWARINRNSEAQFRASLGTCLHLSAPLGYPVGADGQPTRDMVVIRPGTTYRRSEPRAVDRKRVERALRKAEQADAF